MATHTRSGRGTAAMVVRGIGSVLALILVARILFLLLGANPANVLVAWVGRWGDTLALWFLGLFSTGNDTFNVILNYGLAAVFWLVVTGFLARLLYRAA